MKELSEIKYRCICIQDNGMKKIGIDVKGKILYKDIDMFLGGMGIDHGCINMLAQKSSVSHALHKMFTGTHFSIITIENCAELCNIFISKDRIRLYNTQHCMEWAEMTPQHRQMLMVMVLDDFREILN